MHHKYHPQYVHTSPKYLGLLTSLAIFYLKMSVFLISILNKVSSLPLESERQQNCGHKPPLIILWSCNILSLELLLMSACDAYYNRQNVIVSVSFINLSSSKPHIQSSFINCFQICKLLTSIRFHHSKQPMGDLVFPTECLMVSVNKNRRN